MNVFIRVREGYGRELQKKELLTDSDYDRLASNTKSVDENLLIELDIERETRKLGESLGIRFIEGDDVVQGIVYDLRIKDLLDSDERIMAKDLGLPVPATRRIAEREGDISFPFIVKNPESRRGREVYLITDLETFDRLKSFLSSVVADVPSLGGRVEYDPSFEAAKLVRQEYIKTPSERFTSYRVMVGCAGEIFSCCMVYSGNKRRDGVIAETVAKEGRWHKRDLLKLPDSPFFLGTPKVVSNKSAGGGVIVLDPLPASKPATDEEKTILSAHGLDPANPRAPQAIKDLSVRIARYLGDHGKGLVFGIDWIQSEDGRLYYLETNTCPAGAAYLYTHRAGKGTHAEAMIEVFAAIMRTLAVYT